MGTSYRLARGTKVSDAWVINRDEMEEKGGMKHIGRWVVNCQQ